MLLLIASLAACGGSDASPTATSVVSPAAVTTPTVRVATSAPASGSPTSGSASPASGDGLPGEAVPDLGGGHVPDGQTVTDYNSDPPTSGKHWPYTARWGVHDEPVSNEVQVHNLEHGGVVIQYSCDDCADLVSRLSGIASACPVKLLLAPRPGMAHLIAVTAWNRLMFLDAFDEGQIRAFVAAWADKGPETISGESRVFEACGLGIGQTPVSFKLTQRVVFTPQTAGGAPADDTQLEKIRAVIELRVQGFGIYGAKVTVADGEIHVDLPDMDDLQRLIDGVTPVGFLEVIDTGDEVVPAGTVVPTSLGAPEGTSTPRTGSPFTTIVSSDDVIDAYPATAQDGSSVLVIAFSDSGSARLSEFTKAHSGGAIAIIIDNVVLQSGHIRSTLSDTLALGGLDQDAVTAATSRLKSGPLPVPIQYTRTDPLP